MNLRGNLLEKFATYDGALYRLLVALYCGSFRRFELRNDVVSIFVVMAYLPKLQLAFGNANFATFAVVRSNLNSNMYTAKNKLYGARC